MITQQETWIARGSEDLTVRSPDQERKLVIESIWLKGSPGSDATVTMMHVDGHGIASDLLLSENGKVRVNSKIVVTHDSYLRLDAGVTETTSWLSDTPSTCYKKGTLQVVHGFGEYQLRRAGPVSLIGAGITFPPPSRTLPCVSVSLELR